MHTQLLLRELDLAWARVRDYFLVSSLSAFTNSHDFILILLLNIKFGLS